VTSIKTTDHAPSPIPPPKQFPPEGFTDPKRVAPGEEQRAQAGENTDPIAGTGVEGEVNVWEARYSKRNFIGRAAFRVLLTLAWIGLAVYTWSFGHTDWAKPTWVALAIVVAFWIALGFRMIQAHYSHYYRLTNRRLFVSTGMLNRRRDMMELLRVKDVYTRQQSLSERWLGLGTVIVVPHEKDLPTFYLTGVDDPKEVMDLIWHHARAERDQRSVKVENV
jgi:membrane protein YdbS with pleckstrin-like domain